MLNLTSTSLFLTGDFWELITVETNKYLQTAIASSSVQKEGAFKDMSVLKKKFFRLYFSMGATRQIEIRDHWQLKYVINRTPFFTQVMPRKRWQKNWSHLHFADNSQFVPRGQPGHDRLSKFES